MCKIIKYLDYRLNTLEKLYFDLTIMLIVTFLNFLFLVFEFFIYENIAVFFQDCFLKESRLKSQPSLVVGLKAYP
ncbi:hypothetical protein C3W05_09030 [Campylobacter coli]|nr:hypothetical protein [Campylobacter coli]